MPLHESLLNVLLDWKEECPDTDQGWVFASPLTGKPYYSTEIQKRYLRPPDVRLGLGPISWHTFRHTYRSWLAETGAPMKVQQELMRHASIQTTMNVYGKAMPESKGSQWEGRHLGAQALTGERLKCQSTYWE